MDATDFIAHLVVFALPALGLGLLLPLAARVLMPKQASAPAYIAQVAIVFIAGVLVLAAGAWLLGQDGRMATYAALVGVAATVQWLIGRGWRR